MKTVCCLLTLNTCQKNFFKRANIYVRLCSCLLSFFCVSIKVYCLKSLFRSVTSFFVWAYPTPAANWSPSLSPWFGLVAWLKRLRIMIDQIWLLPEAQRSCFWCLFLDTCLWMTMLLHKKYLFRNWSIESLVWYVCLIKLIN